MGPGGAEKNGMTRDERFAAAVCFGAGVAWIWGVVYVMNY